MAGLPWTTTAGLAEFGSACGVGLHFWHFIKAMRQTFQQLAMKRSSRGSERVKNPRAVIATCHQSGIAQIRQMSRRRGLRHFENGDQIADAQFTLLQETQQSNAGGIRECPEHQVRIGF